MNNDCCDPGDVVKSILGTTKDVYNAGVDTGLIDGDRIGKKGRRSLMFDDPNGYDDRDIKATHSDFEVNIHMDLDNDNDDEDDDSDEWTGKCADCRNEWHKEIRQITQIACDEIKKMQAKGLQMREMFWDPTMDHLNILYENPESGQWLKSDLNFEKFL